MDNNSSSSALTIDAEKLNCFQKWCLENNVNSQQVVEKIIDACLANDITIVDLLTNPNHHSQLDQQINFHIQKAIAPLITRIEKLESQTNSTIVNKPINSQKTVNTDLQLFETGAVSPEKNQEEIEVIDPDKVTYLPRNEVWRRLKQTDYVKSAGYDSFLRARGDEFIQYGIYFDRAKKRFYIKKQ